MKVVAVLLLCWVTLACAQEFTETEAAEERCDRSFHLIAGKCYKFHQSKRSWDAALEVCEGEGALLASILTQAQYSGTLDHINANYPGTYWTSGAVVGGRWVWTATGSSMNANWWGRLASTSANRCAYFCSNTLKYWDKACSNSLRFICEKDPASFGPDIRVQAV